MTSQPSRERCEGCGWHRLCADSHDYHHLKTNRGCPVLRDTYAYRLSDTPAGWLDPVHGKPRPGVWSLWRRPKNTDSGNQWSWLAYM